MYYLGNLFYGNARSHAFPIGGFMGCSIIWKMQHSDPDTKGVQWVRRWIRGDFSGWNKLLEEVVCLNKELQ